MSLTQDWGDTVAESYTDQYGRRCITVDVNIEGPFRSLEELDLANSCCPSCKEEYQLSISSYPTDRVRISCPNNPSHGWGELRINSEGDLEKSSSW